jgi:hypothetical protein
MYVVLVVQKRRVMMGVPDGLVCACSTETCDCNCTSKIDGLTTWLELLHYCTGLSRKAEKALTGAKDNNYALNVPKILA